MHSHAPYVAVLQFVSRGERNLALVMDNLVATQKNGIFLSFVVLLVHAHILDCVEVYFLAEYHGKCLIDGAFGTLISGLVGPALALSYAFPPYGFCFFLFILFIYNL